ncbi:hypothetical protein HDU97_001616 [Phlyctochytrium planicorne]|nr:hypothetical protein HDU97_001616 [Phlyctochytrium planicorne]
MSPLRGRRRPRKTEDLSENESDLDIVAASESEDEAPIESEEDDDDDDDDDEKEDDDEKDDDEKDGDELNGVEIGDGGKAKVKNDEGEAARAGGSPQGEAKVGGDGKDAAVTKVAKKLEKTHLSSSTKRNGSPRNENKKSASSRTAKGRGLQAAGEGEANRPWERTDEDFWSKRDPSHRQNKGDAFWLHDDRGSDRRGGFRGGRGGRGGYGNRGDRGRFEGVNGESKGVRPETKKSNDSEEEVLDFKDLQASNSSRSKPSATTPGQSVDRGTASASAENKEQTAWGEPAAATEDWGDSVPDQDATVSNEAQGRRGWGRGGSTTARTAGYGKRGYGVRSNGPELVDTYGGRPGQNRYDSMAKEASPVDQKWTHDKFQPEQEPQELNRRRSWGGHREPRRKADDDNRRASGMNFRSHGVQGETRQLSQSPSRSSSSRRETRTNREEDTSQSDAPAPSSASNAKSPVETSSPTTATRQSAPRRLVLGTGGSGAIPLWKKAAGEAAADAHVAAEKIKEQASLRTPKAETQTDAPPHKSKRYLGSKAVEESLLSEPSEEILKQAVNAPEFVPSDNPAPGASVRDDNHRNQRREFQGDRLRKNFRKDRQPEQPTHEWDGKNENDYEQWGTPGGDEGSMQRPPSAANNWRDRPEPDQSSDVKDGSNAADGSTFTTEFIPENNANPRHGGKPRGRGRGGGPNYGGRQGEGWNGSGSQRPRKQHYQDPRDFNQVNPSYEEYQYNGGHDDPGAIPVQPMLTHSGHVVLITEGGLMVPTDNYMYGGYPPYQGMPMTM